MAGKKAVHFGGGNIGRGFVAELLHKSGFEIVFVDVMDSVIESLQKTKSYLVHEVDKDGEVTHAIDNYRAINSKHEMPKVVEEIATADLVTCAVGPNIAKFIAEPIANGINARKRKDPVAIIACENAINATTTLRGFIENRLSDESKSKLDDLARFANCAVDRIVPQQPLTDGIDVWVEKYYEWVVESTPFKAGQLPAIEGVEYVDDLEPYIERKLYTVNTGHATAAYYGHVRGKQYIHDVMDDKELYMKVKGVLAETASLITRKFRHISEKEQADYVEAILKRFSNPALKDSVTRVGRAPLRKMSRKERFIGPAAQLADAGLKYDNLLGAMEMALRFQNVEGDEESKEMAAKLREDDSETFTARFTGLEKTHALFKSVQKVVEKVQSS